MISRLDGMDEISVRERTLEDADAALERSAILTAVVIPAGFSDALEAGEQTHILFKQRGYGGDTGQIVAAIVSGAALEMGGEIQSRRMVHECSVEGQGITESEIDAVFDRRLALSRLEPAVGVEVHGLGEAEGCRYPEQADARSYGDVPDVRGDGERADACGGASNRDAGAAVDDEAGHQPVVRGEVPVGDAEGDVPGGYPARARIRGAEDRGRVGLRAIDRVLGADCGGGERGGAGDRGGGADAETKRYGQRCSSRCS